MARLFISLDRLDAWTVEGRAALDGEHMILTELGRRFTMTPAVCFVRTTANDRDPYDLLGRVCSKPQLEQMGAEQLANSVIYQDMAYDVIDGFVGEPLPL